MRMMRLLIIGAAAMLTGANAAAAAEEIDLPDRPWSWEGPFGTFDRAQLQRGLQVYTEVCAVCHGLRLVAYRNLGALGYTEDQIKAYAANYEVQAGPDDEGEMYMRPAAPADRFVPPYPNEQAARAVNGGAYPPDLSLVAKSRVGGPDYIAALLTGYAEPPADLELMAGMYYNEYFAGHQIAMPQPLFEDAVEYADGTPATVEQMAEDVAAFLMWAAEPKLEDRKSLGLKVLVFLFIFTGMIVAVKRRVWSDVEH